jgi:tetratricopeptide (TPR) repeat protein
VTPKVPRWALISAAVACAAVLALVLIPRSAPHPKAPAPMAMLPPAAPTQILAPSLMKLAPPAVVVDQGPEEAKLIQDGQKAYDAREFASAEEAFQKAAQLKPEDPVAQMYLGLSQYEQGKLTQAIEPLEKAQTLDPKNGRTDVLLGAVYQELGKTDLARASYNEYLKLDPKGEYSNEVRTILAALPSAPSASAAH